MIAFSCARCGMKLTVKPEFAGRSSKCPSCKQPLVVPMPSATLAFVPPHQIDGTESSLAKAGIDGGITLAQHDTSKLGPLAGKPAVPGSVPSRQSGKERYVIEGEIARGGMGAVLRAVDCDLRREIAVKYMLDAQDPKKQARFVEEAQINSQLEHPNIVPVYDLGIDAQKRPFILMKMVKGRSLKDVLDRLRENPKLAEKEWSLGRLLNIFVNVCNALAFAHSRGVIHRDLKPANIMLGDFGEVYVMDWGLAKVLAGGPGELVGVLAPAAAPTVGGSPHVSAKKSSKVVTSREPEADLTQEGSIIGTPTYMPPEQASGALHALTPRSDVYALGAILYEILTLQPPVDKEGGYLAVLMRVMQGEILAPEQRAPARAKKGKIPRELAAVAMKALARNPGDRYPSAEALRQDIERYQEGRSVSAKEDTYREAVWKLIKRNKAASLAATLALLVLVGSMAFSFQAWRKAVRANQEFVKEQEEKRNQALKAVPAFVESARLSLSSDRRNLDAALAQINVALDYDPDNAEARLLKGQMLIVLGNFTAARTELQEYLRRKPQDGLARKLAELCGAARRDDVPTQLAFAEVFMKQNAPGLADGLLSKYGQTSEEARGKLFDLYRKRIEAAWQGRGQWLNRDPNGIYELYLNNFTQLTDLTPVQGVPLTKLHLSGANQLRDLGPLRDTKLKFLDLSNCSQLRDLAPLKDMPLTWLSLHRCDQVRDLTPLHGMSLTNLHMGGCRQIRDFTPLQGMPLAELGLSGCDQINDLAMLKGLPLTKLDLWESKAVRDLTPLQGMKLTSLRLGWTAVQDLAPLRGMPLTDLSLHFCGQVRDLTPLAGMQLASLDLTGCSQVRDLTPLRGMRFTALDIRFCSQVRDLSALEGMSFTKLDMSGCSQVRDLAPLRGMPLAELTLANCNQVFDLTPLQGMKLTTLNLNNCGLVQDLAPLRGMPLTTLYISGCSQLRDLAPLHDLPLSTLSLRDCGQLQDVAPLRGMKLTTLDIRGCGQVRDLVPLAETTLAEVYVSPKGTGRGIEGLRQLKTLKTVVVDDNRRFPTAEFWKRYDAGEFK
ncbi:hypothetical protein AYO44_07540 [Planctomycetaceae bacterium SCGC AG-212-F19]|nr:hypothetical protein AYO44_07540 [Planctomycetaceae bacterium SCGC AG-212-F19]